MAQLNPDLFSSFQSALDALEQLHVFKNAKDVADLSGDLESLPVELKQDILRYGSLDVCVALSEACPSYRRLWESMEQTQVREKVLRRVPWFQLNDSSTGVTTWLQAAKLVTTRTRHALEKKNGWVPAKSIEVLNSSNLVSHERVDATDVTFDPDLRKKMNPVFADRIIYTLTGDVMQGARLRMGTESLDLKTLIATTGHRDVNIEDAPPKDDNRVRGTPEIELRHVDPEGEVAYVGENDNLIHCRYTPIVPLDGPLEDDPRNLIDAVFHKETKQRDEDGCYVIDPEKLVIQQAHKQECMPLIHLLPGAGGAMIARFASDKQVSSYLGYIEPTPELRHHILCAIPTPARGGFNGFDSHYNSFCLFYNGYIHLSVEGRVIQMWVDLGVQKELRLSREIEKDLGHDTLPQKSSTRALTAFNTNFPMLGTFAPQRELFHTHDVMQGDRNQGMDRWVTMACAEGGVVGDLLTGKTYCCKNPKKQYQLSIPYVKGKKKKTVGFYSFSPYVSSMLLKELRSMRPEMFHGPVDLKPAYSGILELARDPRTNNSTRYVDHYKGTPARDYYISPRIVRANPQFEDEPSEFTNIDGEELAIHEAHREDRVLDVNDWDCGKAAGRPAEEYNRDSDNNIDDSDSEMSYPDLMYKYDGRLPTVHYTHGKKDGLVGLKDDRFDKQDYFKGYHESYRKRFGFTDPKDRDDYWGSHPKHGKWYL
ncbi:hypothetical protein CJU89_6897 [Yarrowia sp. B02]|nr:hypothetical protein CJU89_6897 [Yarrowia sp. B02]